MPYALVEISELPQVIRRFRKDAPTAPQWMACLKDRPPGPGRGPQRPSDLAPLVRPFVAGCQTHLAGFTLRYSKSDGLEVTRAWN